jgi:hypothetical protein
MEKYQRVPTKRITLALATGAALLLSLHTCDGDSNSHKRPESKPTSRPSVTATHTPKKPKKPQPAVTFSKKTPKVTWTPTPPPTEWTYLPHNDHHGEPGHGTALETYQREVGDDNGDGRIDENESGWKCREMGNKTCGEKK